MAIASIGAIGAIGIGIGPHAAYAQCKGGSAAAGVGGHQSAGVNPADGCSAGDINGKDHDLKGDTSSLGSTPCTRTVVAPGDVSAISGVVVSGIFTNTSVNDSFTNIKDVYYIRYESTEPQADTFLRWNVSPVFLFVV